MSAATEPRFLHLPSCGGYWTDVVVALRLRSVRLSLRFGGKTKFVILSEILAREARQMQSKDPYCHLKVFLCECLSTVSLF